jgi:hypothetical protein
MLNEITGNINSIGSFLDAAIATAPKVVTFCAMASAMLPKPASDGILAFLHRVMNLIGFNFGEAANK